jgi:hypothetical protein
MLSRHAGSVQRGAWHVVLAARGADRKTAADGMRAIIDESGGAVGWRATGVLAATIGFGCRMTWRRAGADAAVDYFLQNLTLSQNNAGHGFSTC